MIIRLGVWLIILAILLFVLTTLGLVNTFQDTSTMAGSQKAEALAKGISVNLWYTTFGAIVGVTGSIVLAIGIVLHYKAKSNLESQLRAISNEYEDPENNRGKEDKDE